MDLETHCHSREQFFMWQSYVHGLPTYSNLHKATCVNNNLCPLCSSEAKTHLHSLRDCIDVKPIWLSLNPPQ